MMNLVIAIFFQIPYIFLKNLWLWWDEFANWEPTWPIVIAPRLPPLQPLLSCTTVARDERHVRL